MIPNADEIQRALDNGHVVVLFRNGMGSYTAATLVMGTDVARKVNLAARRGTLTDDFSPSKALHRLAEKLIGNVADFTETTP
jgi:hypothetical protein